MGKVSDRILELVLIQIKARGIVVWYDPDKRYEGLVNRIKWPYVTVLDCGEAGLFQLRHRLEAHLEFVTEDGRLLDDCSIPPRVLVYVPMEREDTSQALVEPETAGVVMEPDAPDPERNTRLSIQVEAVFRGIAPERASDLARQAEEGVLSLDELDRVAENLGEAGSGVLDVVFGKISPSEVIMQFASSDAKDSDLVDRKAVWDVGKLAVSELGIQVKKTQDPGSLRETLRRMIVLGDFASRVHNQAALKRLGAGVVPEKPAHREAVRHLASTWREREDLREGYIEAAKDAEAHAGPACADLTLSDMEDVETFRCIEAHLQRVAEQALMESRAEEACRLVGKREASFWSRAEPGLLVRWLVLGLAGRFMVAAKEAKALPLAQGSTVAEMVRNYADQTSPGLMADRFYRHWEGRLSSLEAMNEVEEVSDQLRAKVRRENSDLLDASNRAFCAALISGGGTWQGCRPQRRVFIEKVMPSLEEGQRTAFLMVDALRYEMAGELLQGLGNEFSTDLDPYLASIPTITSMGMASLLPGADTGFNLAESKGGLSISVAGEIVKDRQSRMAILEKVAPGETATLTLADLLKMGPKGKKDLAEAKFVVVTSQEIDLLGEDAEKHADCMGWMQRVLEHLGRAIRLLAKLGFERIVVSADHGFIYREQTDPGMVMDPPGGNTVELHSRAWVGKGGSQGPGFVRLSAKQAAVNADLEFAFPKGLGCFRAKGGAGAYLHGGVSLQEMIVPVATLRPKAQGPKRRQGKDRVDVVLKSSKAAITNRLFTLVAALTDEALIPVESLRVRATVACLKTEAGECVAAEYGFDEGTREIVLERERPNTLTFVLTKDDGKEVSVKLIDCRTQLELPCAVELPVRLGI